jgi:hypothetical protein
MAFRAPYAEQYGHVNQHSDEFNPYIGSQQPHKTYEPDSYEDNPYADAAYRDEPHFPPPPENSLENSFSPAATPKEMSEIHSPPEKLAAFVSSLATRFDSKC